jgi:hypothetical protein
MTIFRSHRYLAQEALFLDQGPTARLFPFAWHPRAVQ